MGKVRKFNKRQKWTQEEIDRLIVLSERYTQSGIARLMNRELSSVKGKLHELQLGGLMDRTDRWTITQVAEAVGMDKGTIYRTWSKYGLKSVKRGLYRLIKEEDLIKFMKEHPERWDATKCDYYLFYKYPWFMEKLEQDKKQPSTQKKREHWTDYQKQQFVLMKRRGFTHREIAESIGKTKLAVDHYNMRYKAI